jgi:uncharacterized protein (TIGR02147 family)
VPRTTPPVVIYEYLDYRAYLRAVYAERKQRQPGFSYRWFSQRAGMTSPNFLKLVIEGKRNLTPKSADQFAKALGLGTKESDFFRDLVAFNQAPTPAERNRRFSRIGKYRKHRAVRRLEHNTFEYLSHWYYPAIRELVGCDGFREDPSWIGQRLEPKVAPAQVTKAVAVLLKLGVLERDAKGRLAQGEPLLSTGPEVRSLAVGNFHRQMMAQAARSIEAIAGADREISGVTVALSKRGFEMFKQKIHELRSELLELSAEEPDATRVVQFNFQAFPLADVAGRDG